MHNSTKNRNPNGPETAESEELLTVLQVSERLGLSQMRVRQLLQEHGARIVKWGKNNFYYHIPVSEVERIERERAATVVVQAGET